MSEIIPSQKCIAPLDAAERITIKDFFRGRNVFITGSTGFMGKVLVEKLLWSCRDIGNLYLLIRPKKGEDAAQRIEEMLKLPVFDRLKERDSTILSKIIPIAGDVAELNLGISEEDRNILQDTVSVVFHAAATVRFNEPLKKAIFLNARGTREVLNLSKAMKNLKVMVHVSTCYANSDKKVIEERLYYSGVDWREMIEMAENIDENILNILESKILDRYANTYTFSKNLAESIVNDYRHEIPILIYRPSIVTFSFNEPTPGWLENMNGVIGISVGIITGVLHTLHGDGHCINDFMPCDYAINGLISSAWYRGIVDSDECIIVNAASGDNKKISADFLLEFMARIMERMPPKRFLWYPSIVVTKNRLLYLMLVYLTHLLPAVILDLGLSLTKIKFRFVTLYGKIFATNELLSFFTLRQWTIVTRNYDSLKTYMHPSDKDTFVFDMATLDVNLAVDRGTHGMKKFLLKEDTDDESLLVAKKRVQKMYIVDRLLKGTVIIWISWIILKILLNYFF